MANGQYSDALYTWTSILVPVERVEFVRRFTGRHIRADTKFVVFSMITLIDRRDCCNP